MNTAGEAPVKDLMDGVDINWKRIEGGDAIQSMINAIIGNYSFEKPEGSVPALVKLYSAIKSLHAGNWRNKKLEEVQQLIEACGALYTEVTSSQQKVVQGDSLKLSIVFNKRTAINVLVKNISFENIDTSLAANLSTNQNLSIGKAIVVNANKPISQPYWLMSPLTGGTFEVNDQLLIGKAENDPSFEASFLVNIEGEDFVIRRPVQYRVIDPVKGDLYQPIAVLTKIELSYTRDNFIVLNNKPAKAGIEFKSNVNESHAYPVVQDFSGNWKADDKSFIFDARPLLDSSYFFNFSSQSAATNTTEEIHLKSADGKFNGYTKTIAYDHIPTITYFPRAKANLVKLDIKIIGKKIGYIIGAGDKVPQALEAMGYEVKILAEADLNDDNLKQYDAIVTGIRAYNINEYLSNKNDVLMRYVQNGGNLIVQYLKSNLVGQKKVKVGPYPFIVDPGVRVTEEDATVNFLLPDHPVLNYPNKVTAADFTGWVQERSTYQALQLDPHYETPLGMNDKGEKESNGSLAIAKYGKGNFIYASLVFFRELPAGVPGAYRLMANLVALEKNK